MNKLLLAAVALLATVGVSTANAADTVTNTDRAGFYVGGNLGSSTDNKSRIDLGGVAGYQVAPYARVEASYDHAWRQNGAGNMLLGNAVAQYNIPGTTVTPYVLAGAGVGFDRFGAIKNGNTVGLYDVGAGVRVAVSSTVELDARYRNVRTFADRKVGTKDQNLFSVGVNYRF